MRLLSTLAPLLFCFGCTLGAVWAPRLEGRVVDGVTGRPVAGALVEASYHVRVVAAEPSGFETGRRSTTTDADGRFVLRPRFALDPALLALTDRTPRVSAAHPEYGEAWPQAAAERDRIEIRLFRDDAYLSEIRAPRKDWPCITSCDAMRAWSALRRPGAPD